MIQPLKATKPPEEYYGNQINIVLCLHQLAMPTIDALGHAWGVSTAHYTEHNRKNPRKHTNALTDLAEAR